MEQLVYQSTLFTTLHSCFQYLLQAVKTLVQLQQECRAEMGLLQDMGFLYDESSGEVVVESKGRVFIFLLDCWYPLCGLEHVKVVGVEPMPMVVGLKEWNEKIHEVGADRLIDLLPFLE